MPGTTGLTRLLAGLCLLCAQPPASAQEVLPAPTTPDSYRHLTPATLRDAEPALARALEQISGYLLNGDISGLRNMLSIQNSRRVTQDQMQLVEEVNTQRCGPPAKIELLEVHIAEYPPDPPGFQRRMMTPILGRSVILPSPVLVSSPASGISAVALFKREFEGAGCWLTVVLEQHNTEGWRFYAQTAGASTGAGHDGEWYLRRGDQFAAEVMPRNAYFYRSYGLKLLNTMFITPQSGVDYALSLPDTAPRDLPLHSLNPTVQWQVAGQAFTVDFVDMLTSAGDIGLEVRYQSSQEAPESAPAAAERRALAEHLCAAFPEYRRGFDMIFIAAVNKASKGYRQRFDFSPDTPSGNLSSASCYADTDPPEVSPAT